IRENLLQDAKQRAGGRVVEFSIRTLNRTTASHSSLSLELLGLPLNRRKQPKLIQNSWPQLGRNLPHSLDGAVDQSRRRSRSPRYFAIAFPTSREKPCHLHFQSGERLPKHIVNFARDAFSLLFPD